MGLIAIGDIHGCAASLGALLDRLDLTPDDHIVFIGDYIDRGPDSNGVIARLLKLAQTHHCTFLRGNHESFMIDYFDYKESELWRVNGGLQTMESYLTPNGRVEIPDTHVDFVKQTKLYFETDGYFFVHAGLKPHLTIRENLDRYGAEVFLWERSHLDYHGDLSWEKPVVCGHTPRPLPINERKLIAIDTGCVYFRHPQLGRLTAVRLPEREFVAVPYTG
jgi:serine/threonine protein phosphatase 1